MLQPLSALIPYPLGSPFTDPSLFPPPQSSLACSCADCQLSCPVIPDTWDDGTGTPWLMFGYDGLAVAMCLTAILCSAAFLVIFAYCHKRNKKYKGEWRAGGVDREGRILG